MNSKKIIVGLFIFTLMFVMQNQAYAHVVVRPAEVGVGAFQTFTIGVPVEKEIATTEVRLVLPEGLNHVTPNVKPGWNIEVVHAEAMTMEEDDDHAHAPVTEIIWRGGVIPQGQRDEFLFSAQVPAEETTLSWKAYQTYADGTVVSWELGSDEVQPKDEEGNSDYSQFGPASETKVINDLSEGSEESNMEDKSSVGAHDARSGLALGLSVIAIVLSVVTTVKQQKKK